MDEREVFLSQELKKLVGWGSSPHRLPFLPTLRELAGAGDHGSLLVIGYQIRQFLADEIDTLTGTYKFMEREVEAEKLRRAYRLLLKIEGTGFSAVRRRGSVIMLLGTYCSVDQWRRPVGPEMEFLMILASHMIGRHHDRDEAA